MKNPKHTPGPWSIREQDTIDYENERDSLCGPTAMRRDYLVIESPLCDKGYEHSIARVSNSVGVIGICEHEMPDDANAALITAAPEMLESLMEVDFAMASGQYHEIDLIKLRAAIKKARGE